MEKEAHHGHLLTASNLRKTGMQFSEISKSEAHKILDRVRDGKYAPNHLIMMALKATGDLIEADQAADEPAVSSGYGCN